MKRFIYIILFILFICSFAFAQTAETNIKSKCPSISIAGPPIAVKAGETQTFILTINGEYDEKALKIEWLTDVGTIVNGQGTKILTVINNDDDTITVTANVYAGNGCVLTAVESGFPSDPPFCRLFDEIGKISEEDLKQRINLFKTEIQNNPGSQDYIINYGLPKDVRKREMLIRDNFGRDYPLTNIVFVSGGKEEQVRTGFWIVPAGADASTTD